jgi:hypothetical protein
MTAKRFYQYSGLFQGKALSGATLCAFQCLNDAMDRVRGELYTESRNERTTTLRIDLPAEGVDCQKLYDRLVEARRGVMMMMWKEAGRIHLCSCNSNRYFGRKRRDIYPELIGSNID